MNLDSSKIANVTAIIALGISLVTAGTTIWLGVKTNDLQDQANRLQAEANKFQEQQPDLAIANNVLVANASDYPVKEWPPSKDIQIVINLSHRTILHVSADMASPYRNVPSVAIGDMPACTEANIRRQLPALDWPAVKVRSLWYATPDQTRWYRDYWDSTGYNQWESAPSSKPIAAQVSISTLNGGGSFLHLGSSGSQPIKVSHGSLVRVPRSDCP